METTLQECLGSFVSSVNANERMATLLKGWEPQLVIEATDSGQQFRYRVQGCRIGEIAGEPVDDGDNVMLRSDSATLVRVFSGALNPAQAYLEGNLEVFGSDRDQIKLVLWGL